MSRALVRRGRGRVHIARTTDDGWVGVCGRRLQAEPVCPNDEAPEWAVDHEADLCGNCRETALVAAGA